MFSSGLGFVLGVVRSVQLNKNRTNPNPCFGGIRLESGSNSDFRLIKLMCLNLETIISNITSRVNVSQSQYS